jgi:hypothetical protein
MLSGGSGIVRCGIFIGLLVIGTTSAMAQARWGHADQPLAGQSYGSQSYGSQSYEFQPYGSSGSWGYYNGGSDARAPYRRDGYDYGWSGAGTYGWSNDYSYGRAPYGPGPGVRFGNFKQW